MDLDPKIKEEINNLQKNYNIVQEYNDINYLASRRVEITKFWIPKLLKLSLYLNIMTVICILISILILLQKPEPKYFGTTPNGKVIPLETVKLRNTNKGIIIEKK
jgi:hypothetical protein